MKRRFRLSRELLRESDDALRSILGLLEDVVPVTIDGTANALDIHLALGALDELYADDREASATDKGGFRAAARSATRLGRRGALGA
ncbi:MAG: hypothetical protein HKO98_06665 [Gemmatimonadetes bacterium]|nr:hypothetical protein [Gemmatimonadota bacterium]